MSKLSHAQLAVGHGLGAGLEALLWVGIIIALAISTAVVSGISPVGAGTAFAGRSESTITVADGRFGEITTASVSQATAKASTAIAGTWVHVTCVVDANGSLGLVAWEPTDASGHAKIALGPTPSWQAGSAKCAAEAGSWDKASRFRVSSKTTFTVSE